MSGSTRMSHLKAVTGTSRGDTALAVLLVAAACLMAFGPGLKAGFTSWDDDILVTANPLVRSFSLPGIFTTFQLGNYHPLTTLSYAVEHLLFGLRPEAFHATNLLLHIMNVLLLLLFLRRLGTPPWPAAGAALLFAVHPTRVESVCWIADRKDLLAAFFALLCLTWYVSRTRKTTVPFYWLSLAAFVAACLSKATAVTLVPVLFLLDYLADGRVRLARFWEKVPFLAAGLVLGITALVARASFQGALKEQSTLPATVGLGVYRLVFYFLPRIVAPLDLTTLNPFYRGAIGTFPSTGEIVLAAALLTALLGATAVVARRSRAVWFGVLFILVTISPVLSVIVLGFSADRFTYLPAVGFACLAGTILTRFARGATGGRVAVLTLVVALVTGGLLTVSRERCSVWHDSRSVWTEAVRLYPDVPNHHNNLGNAHREAGDMEEALASYTRALQLDPGHTLAMVNRAATLSETGENRRALQDLDRALDLEPENAGARNNRGIVLARMGHLEEALLDFDAAVRTDPGYADAFLNRGNVKTALGKVEEALLDYTAALALDPFHPRALRNRALTLAVMGRHAEAQADLRNLESLSGPADGFRP